MIPCPSCNSENPKSGKFCSSCGAALNSDPVISSDPVATELYEATKTEEYVRPSQSDSSHHGRFLPGTKVAGRYRIVSLVGKGGMGEVYRADDLTLGHTVALKFLPKSFADDPKRLEMFHNEVRLTRQVSHPNVCRVHDIGEVNGQHFLSMEYIDGEDLKILLHRIGRLPKAKGIELAQQLCAGLSAAHDKGVLHRDLKPANIMIDGHGQVRITDFGLAKLTQDNEKREIAGTPAYMAPEQLSLGETSIKSDLFSLGLIFYELFTGESVHKTNSIPKLLKEHQDVSISQPSRLIDDMDPVVENVILHCLEKEPERRPKSCHAVAQALPGGDPLAAALAAGDTPSPEMVASAGDTSGLKPPVAIAALIGVALFLIINCWLAEKTYVVNQADLQYEPGVLAVKAQEMVQKNLGYSSPSFAEIHGFLTENGSLRFWYRQRDEAPFTMHSFWNVRAYSRGRPTFSTPSWEHPNELGIQMNPDGKLRYFRAHVPQIVTANTTVVDSSKLPWARWFPAESTGFNLSLDDSDAIDLPPNSTVTKLTPVSDRTRTPPDAFDAVQVWQGVDKQSGDEIFVEAAAYRGKPVYFEVFSAAQFEMIPAPATENLGEEIWYGLTILIMIYGIVLAWRNMRSRSSDQRGAMRFSGFVFCMGVIIWLMQAQHSFSLGIELRTVVMGISQALFDAGTLWIVYIAFEPVVRKIWPENLISWTRLMDGRIRDPIIGRDFLFGAVGGMAIMFLLQVNLFLHFWILNQTPNMKGEVQPISLAGSKELVASVLEGHLNGLHVAAILLMTLLLFRIVLRSERGAAIAWSLILIFFLVLSSGSSFMFAWLPFALMVGIQYVLLVRLGFLALVVQMTVVTLATTFPLTLDINHWYFSHGLFAIVWISAIAVYGFYTSQGGRPLLKQ